MVRFSICFLSFSAVSSGLFAFHILLLTIEKSSEFGDNWNCGRFVYSYNKEFCNRDGRDVPLYAYPYTNLMSLVF